MAANPECGLRRLPQSRVFNRTSWRYPATSVGRDDSSARTQVVAWNSSPIPRRISSLLIPVVGLASYRPPVRCVSGSSAASGALSDCAAFIAISPSALGGDVRRHHNAGFLGRTGEIQPGRRVGDDPPPAASSLQAQRLRRAAGWGPRRAWSQQAGHPRSDARPGSAASSSADYSPNDWPELRGLACTLDPDLGQMLADGQVGAVHLDVENPCHGHPAVHPRQLADMLPPALRLRGIDYLRTRCSQRPCHNADSDCSRNKQCVSIYTVSVCAGRMLQLPPHPLKLLVRQLAPRVPTFRNLQGARFVTQSR